MSVISETWKIVLCCPDVRQIRSSKRRVTKKDCPLCHGKGTVPISRKDINRILKGGFRSTCEKCRRDVPVEISIRHTA